MKSPVKIFFLFAFLISVFQYTESKAQFNFYNYTNCDVDINLDAGALCAYTCNSGWYTAHYTSNPTLIPASGCGFYHTLTMQIGSTRKTVVLQNCLPGHVQTKYNDCGTGDSELSIIDNWNGQYIFL